MVLVTTRAVRDEPSGTCNLDDAYVEWSGVKRSLQAGRDGADEAIATLVNSDGALVGHTDGEETTILFATFAEVGAKRSVGACVDIFGDDDPVITVIEGNCGDLVILALVFKNLAAETGWHVVPAAIIAIEEDAVVAIFSQLNVLEAGSLVAQTLQLAEHGCWAILAGIAILAIEHDITIRASQGDVVARAILRDSVFDVVAVKSRRTRATTSGWNDARAQA